MKKKIVLALLTATVAGTALTGCGGKTAETAPAETVETTEEASDEEAEVSEKSAEDSIDESLDENDAVNVEVTDEEATAEGEEAVSEDEVDESTILDTDVPTDPYEAMDIVNSIKDPKIKYQYLLKANDYFINQDDEVFGKWDEASSPYVEDIVKNGKQ